MHVLLFLLSLFIFLLTLFVLFVIRRLFAMDTNNGKLVILTDQGVSSFVNNNNNNNNKNVQRIISLESDYNVLWPVEVIAFVSDNSNNNNSTINANEIAIDLYISEFLGECFNPKSFLY